MAGVLQHLRSSMLNKRPNPASMVDGQLAINYASGSPGAFFKDTNGNLVKVGPVHVGATAPNVSPASGGTAGNSLGEQWLDTSGGTYVFKIWDGAAWRSEAGEFVNSTGDTMTGSLTMGPSANLIFEGSTDDGFETTLTVVDPTADRTITLPNVSGTVVTTGDTGTITSTMIADGTIVDGDINASAAIAGTKISPAFGSQNVTTTGTSTAASFIPTSSTVPTNGVYLPAANSVAISTNSTQRLLIDASGNVNIDSNTLYVDATNNRVGIGTTSNRDSTKLDVLGDITFGANASNYGTLGYNAGTGHLEFTSNDGAFKWIRRSGFATSMVLDNSGRLLVGTSSARSNVSGFTPDVQIEGVSSSAINSIIRNTADAGGSALILGKSRGSTVGSNTVVSANDTVGTIRFAGNDGTNFIDAAFIRAEVDGTPSTNDMPGRLVFSTTADGASSPTERMRISNSGRQTNFNGDAYTVVIRSSNASGTSDAFLGCTSGATDITGTSSTLTFQIYTNGNVQNTNNSYGAISDIKLKENIVDANSQWADIKALQVRKYNFKEGQIHTQIGLVAQEVELVSPGLVSESPDRDEDGNDLGTVTKSVNYSVLYMKAVKALQEAMERIETLEAKVAALESA